MKNGHLDTGFIVTWLAAHNEDFYASAPETHDGIAVEAHRIDDELHFYEKCGVRSNISETVQLRNDWTIRIDSGEPVRDDALNSEEEPDHKAPVFTVEKVPAFTCSMCKRSEVRVTGGTGYRSDLCDECWMHSGMPEGELQK